MEICEYCQKELKNKIALAAHQRSCKLNPNSKESPFKISWKRPWNKGLTKETDSRILIMSRKSKKTLQEKPSFLGRKHSEETLFKMSKSRCKLYKEGWEPVCGRCKKYDYISPIAGKIKVDGTWELKVCIYLDQLKVKWERNKRRFEYTRPDGKLASYQPDFFVEDWNLFIEVKGYQTELDEAKWNQFPHKLEVWKKDKIKSLEDKS